eukprot:CAMPEP_0201739054 /NCGR_PEP_ID=MMETSP0593-20130828/45570_1 /ASSEMBLY_ACC=CAM_ASM_000672 /TAXON_ID=267983 /ORGANISM="Skeletonema japonicum, Strain CCMP2506" /LENGTH=806 /DNA_ID=CAMNT_0048233293 /DNA_START=126 /DNA_END=2547 /DNA_ORIENTATION=+
MVSGVASSIRSSLESSTFDLAGHDATSIQSITRDAFSTPFPPLDQMIRITFVVGAGKLSRQKYDAKAMQILTAALRELEYVEDRGAGCSLDCAGCFKTQHDTGKNLFTVVVFPKLSASNNSSNNANGGENEEDEPLLPTNSPGYKIAVCSISTFQSLLSSQCSTYAQKRKCMECIEGLMELLQSIEEKLMGGHPLDSAEQSLYDEMDDLSEKLAFTQKEAAKHVDEGLLTVEEKEMLVEMNQKRISVLMKEKSSAAVAEKLKKALARKEHLQRITDEKLSSLSSSDVCPEKKVYGMYRRADGIIAMVEDKLMGGHPLDSAEQALYDEMGELKEKLAYTQKEAAQHVDDGLLTVHEKEMLVEMNQKRISVLTKQKSSAAVAEKLKKALARKERLQSLSDEKLSSSSTYPPPLRHEAKITPLRKKLLPLLALEGKAKGGFLTLAETKALTEKEEIETVAEKLKKALARKEHLQRITDEKLSSLSSTYPPPLRHESKITPLRKKLLPLLALEGKAKGGFLTLAETRALTEKEEIESEIEHLEEVSYGWFEEEDAFEERLQKSRDKFNAKYAKKGGGKASAKKTSAAGRSGGGGNSVNKWVLPGQKQQGSSTWGASSGKKKGGKGGAVFSAMMMDDSSSDEEELPEEKVAPTPVRAAVAKTNKVGKDNNSSHPGSSNFIKVKGGQSAPKSNVTNSSSNNNNNTSQVEATSAPKSKSKNKSKKKKKKAKQSQTNDVAEEKDQNEEENQANSGDASAVIKSVDEATISNSLNMFWNSFLRPFLMFLISCLVSLVSGLIGGKDSKKGGKKKRR